MFFVEKKNKNSKNSVLQLMKSQRVNGKPKQIIVLSLGADYPIPKKLRKAVAKSITNKLRGEVSLFADPEVEKYSEAIIRRIQQKGDRQYTEKINKQEDIREVFIDQVYHKEDRIAGPVLIGDSMWKRLKMDEILTEVGFRQKDTKIAEISILNRLISHEHEYALPIWTKIYSVGDIVYNKAEDLGKDIFYRISDKLLSKQSKIEELLYRNVKNIFGLDSSILLYDLTNTYFEGTGKLNPKAKFNGNQKEKRTDCRQIVIALILDGDGFVIKHKIFNGKMSDAKSLSKILSSIKGSYEEISDVPTLIFDRGVTSDENIELLLKSGLKYIIASRNNLEKEYMSEFINADFSTIMTGEKKQVKVFLKREAEENYLLCKSVGRKQKEESMRTKKEILFIEELQKLKNQIFSRKKNKVSEISEKIGKARAKYSTVSQYYDVEYKAYEFDFEILKPINGNLLKMLEGRKSKFLKNDISYKVMKADIEKYSKKYADNFANINLKLEAPVFKWSTIEEKLAAKMSMEGNYLLRTNRDDLDEKSFWHIYTMLTRIEHAFRHLKTDLGLRPNYHHLEHRVDGHVFISILAYQLLQSIEYTLRQKDCNLSWSSVRRIMTSHTYSTIVLPTRNGKTVHIRRAGEAEEVQRKLYKILNIDYKTLPKSKLIY